MHALEMFQERRKDVQTNGHAANKPEGASERPRAVCDAAHGVTNILKDPLAELYERLSGGRHPNLTAYPQEKRFAEFLFEKENLTADGGLRHVQLPPAGRERSGFGNGLQDFQLAQVH